MASRNVSIEETRPSVVDGRFLVAEASDGVRASSPQAAIEWDIAFFSCSVTASSISIRSDRRAASEEVDGTALGGRTSSYTWAYT